MKPQIRPALAAALLAVTATAGTAGASTPGDTPGAVYAMTNDATNNEVVVFDRAADGMLTLRGSFATGGRGSGTAEDSSNGLVLANVSGDTSPNNIHGTPRFLIATNSGSDDVSVFRTDAAGGGLVLVDREPSNGGNPAAGGRPISVSVSKGVAYVLNASGPMCSGVQSPPNVTGFRIDARGDLTPIPGSTRYLSGGQMSGCNQVSFDPSGRVLVVTQQQADLIDTFLVDQATGLLTGPIVNQTTGNGPFGFAFTQRDQLVTTENFGAAPFQGGAASYDVERDGTLTPLSPTVRNGQGDTCWAVITDDNRFAFITNFQTGTISSYRVLPDGMLVLLQPAEEFIGIGAADEALSTNSRYLYALNSVERTISGFRVENDGSLTPIDTEALPPTLSNTIGIAAR